MLAVTPESAPCSEQGQEELRYSSCVCCPNSSPGKAAKAGLKIRPFAHMGSARVCLCVQTTLNDLKVFYNLGTAELSPSSGPRTWNIHAAAKGNQWKKPSGSQVSDWKWSLPPGLKAEKKSFEYWMCHDKNSVFRRGHESIYSGYLSSHEPPWSQRLSGSSQAPPDLFVPLEQELRSIGWSLAFLQQGCNALFPLKMMTLPFGWHWDWAVPDFKRLRISYQTSSKTVKGRKTGKCQPISSVFLATCLCFPSSTLKNKLVWINILHVWFLLVMCACTLFDSQRLPQTCFLRKDWNISFGIFQHYSACLVQISHFFLCCKWVLNNK